ncbi:Hsp33 family molecular chaperone [Amorphus orientalis]|uniref:Molecular chaperone Hsp33 n=1 Tax=Amorphus orientalis TaxID=649198 RepID=A0AAE3VS26_9HYPH|nr:Hsp33 family molecular chaperone [Amorphus orientalis]MDQ0316780.1 molecular chaperone Hsp33 [Amorphus orientalis]
MSDPGTGAVRLPADDLVLPFSVNALDVRGRVAHLGPVVDTVLSRHGYPEPVARLLGEALVLTVLLGSALKFEGRFITQIQSDGPVSLLVVDFRSPDQVRAYARFDDEAIAALVAAGTPSFTDLVGEGHLALTIDPGGHMRRYQGVVPLSGDSLEEVAHAYFAQSEQIPTTVRLAVAEVLERHDGEGMRHSWRAGGLMMQFLPESEDRIRHRDLDPGDAPDAQGEDDVPEDDAWVEALARVGTVEDHELIDPDVAPPRLLLRLFHQRDVHVFDATPVAETCGCSREKVEGILRQFDPEERSEMVEDGDIIVTCEFCSTVYRFDPSDFEADA